MRQSKFVRRAAATVMAAAAIVFMIPATDAWAQVCKLHSHTGFGIGRFPVVARRNAFANWRSQVVSHDGPRWIAPCGSGQSCRRVSIRGYRCTFRARPSRVIGR
jgi:hypothetical protein